MLRGRGNTKTVGLCWRMFVRFEAGSGVERFKALEVTAMIAVRPPVTAGRGGAWRSITYESYLAMTLVPSACNVLFFFAVECVWAAL